MTQFKVFPAGMDFTSVPDPFFSILLPEIDDINELKVTLWAIRALYRKKGYPRFVTPGELLEDPSVVSGLPEPAAESLAAALKRALERGVFINLPVEREGQEMEVYLLNTWANRQALSKIRSGGLKLRGLKASGQPALKTEPQPDVFKMYEQNIGLITPMIADELREAAKSYPEGWLGEAFKEAVKNNKRKWSYISAILERWAVEGKVDGAYQRDSQAGPDKYLRQKYGNMVQR